ncbi:MAG: CHAT domain-containing tetratricopeptide repeat protein [Chitinophagaceae bacterium]
MKTFYGLLLILLTAFHSPAQDIRTRLAALDTAYAKGDYTKAAQLATALYPDRSLIRDDTALVEFISTCGSLQYKLENYEKAARFFGEAAETAKDKLGETEYHYPLAVFNLASSYKELGRYAEAEPLFLKSLPPLAGVFGQSSVEYTRCFYTLGVMYVDMDKYAEAESMCAAAVNFYKTILGDTSADYLGALGTMGVIYQGQAKYDKAEQIYLALKEYHLTRAATDAVTLQTLENNLGDLYRHMGDYDKAEPVLENAVKLAGDSPAAAVSLNNLALVQKALGKYAEAEASFKNALRIYIAAGKNHHPDYTNPLNNLGELYRTMGRLQDAVYAFEEVIELRKKLLGTAHPNYANALNNLALVEFAIGRYSDAEQHLDECREIYKKTLGEKDKYYANSLNNLASVYKAEGRLQKAEEFYKECLSIYKATYGEKSDKYAIYLGGLAGTYRQMKRYNEAIALMLQSLEILRNKLGENHYDYIETEYNLAETYREAGKPAEAGKYYLPSMKGYLLLIEKYFPFLSEKDKTLFYYNVANAFETFNSFVIQLYKQDPAGKNPALLSAMYNNQVALKSLLLKESGKIRAAVAVAADSTVKKEYRQWLAERETIAQCYRLSPEDLAVKGVNLAQLEVNANNLEQKIAIALKLNTNLSSSKPVKWNDIQAALKPGEAAVEMVKIDYYDKGRWTDTVYYAALVIDKTCTAPQLVLFQNGNQLEGRLISGYRISMKSRLDDLQSYNAFWLPLQKFLGKAATIYFSPDGVYQQVNLYTLLNPATRKYLIDEVKVNLVTNTKDILQASPALSSDQAVIFSYPDYGSAPVTADAPLRWTGFPVLDELPGTKTEADSVKQVLSVNKWVIKEYLRKEANEEAIKKINRPGILHIATHGFFLKDIRDTAGKVYGIQAEIARQNPLLRSGVILAGAAAVANNPEIFSDQEDGILTAYEAAGLDLSGTELVVLSACETGLGEILNGQGVYGLQRSFLLAGARSVIMSLWKVSDNSTRELMTLFYKEWLKNPAGSKQQALRAAQIKLRETYKHPFYWGAFVMVGD